jgi:hypothetical protein
MTTEEIKTLLNDARCIDCNIPQGMQIPVLINLLDTVSVNTGVAIANMMEGYSGNYAGVAPTIVPDSNVALAVDSSNREVWIYYSGGWHDSGVALAP